MKQKQAGQVLYNKRIKVHFINAASTEHFVGTLR